jgi:putative zinc finger protein
MNPGCAGVREGLSALLDGALSPSERILLLKHLESCAGCRAEHAAIETTRALVASAGRVRAPRAWVDRAVQAAGTAKLEARPDPGGALPDRRHVRRIFRPWALTGLASAATMVVVVLALRLVSVEGPAPDSGVAHPRNPLPGIASSPARDSAMPAPAAPGAKPVREEKPAARAGEFRKDQRKPEAPPQAEPAAGVAGSVAQVQVAPPPAPTAVASEVAVAAKIAPEPVVKIALAQIRFPADLDDIKAKEASGSGGSVNEIDKRGFASREPRAASPPVKRDALMVRAAASQARGRTVRVKVTLDGESRVVAAECAEEHPSREGADLVARLPGATIDLGGPPAQVSLDQPAAKGPPITADRAKAVTAIPSTREMILEIDLGEEKR